MRSSTSSSSPCRGTGKSSSSSLEEKDVYPSSKDSEVLGDLGFLCANGCEMVGNGHFSLGDSLFFC